MKRIITLLLAVVLILSCLMATGCKAKHKQFGRFSYNGNWLTSFAIQDISYETAKTIVHRGEQSTLYNGGTPSLLSTGITKLNVNDTDPFDLPLPEEDYVNAILTKYASITVVTKYYVTGEKKQLEKTDFLQGTDLKNLLRENEFTPFSQLVTKGIIIFDKLIIFMDEKNTEFKNSKENTTAPFNNIFTYHTDEQGNIVIQTHDFAEIPSSVGGGVACSYLQDTEQLYDSENKLVKWQTSLGVYTATPEGTLEQGYILEVEFQWNEKQ